MRRKHRRVHHPRTNCKCPPHTKMVSTCKKTGGGSETSGSCKGRNVGCIAMVLVDRAKRPVPRFVPLICGPEAGPVEQWKPKPGTGYRKKKKRPRGKQPVQLTLFGNRPLQPSVRPVPEPDDDYNLPFTF